MLRQRQKRIAALRVRNDPDIARDQRFGFRRNHQKVDTLSIPMHNGDAPRNSITGYIAAEIR
jgi:hypothetical protein